MARTSSHTVMNQQDNGTEKPLKMHDIKCPKCKAVIAKVMVGTIEFKFAKFNHKCGAKGFLYWTPNQGSEIVGSRKAKA